MVRMAAIKIFFFKELLNLGLIAKFIDFFKLLECVR